MSILLIDSLAMYGGGQRMLLPVASALAAWKPVVVRPTGAPEDLASYRVPVLRLPLPAFSPAANGIFMVAAQAPAVLHAAGHLLTAARRLRTRMLVANDLYALIPGLLAGSLLGLPLVATIHDLVTPRRASHLLRRCAAVVACSRAVAASLPPGHGSLLILPNGVPEPSLPPRSPRSSWSVLCCSRLDREKNLDALIRAVELAEAALAAHGDFALTIAGDGPERTALEAQIRVSPASHRIQMLGWRKDLERLWSGSDALVLPSPREALPLSLIEGQLAGLPVMGVRNAGGVGEVIEDGVTGILADDPSAPALAAALLRLRLESPGGILAENGRVRARQRFSLDAHATGWQGLVHRLIGPP